MQMHLKCRNTTSSCFVNFKPNREYFSVTEVVILAVKAWLAVSREETTFVDVHVF